MYKKTIGSIVTLVVFLILQGFCFAYEVPAAAILGDDDYSFENEWVLGLVKPSAVFAVTGVQCSLFSKASKESKPLLTVQPSTELEIIEDKSYKWYRVREKESGVEGWVEVKEIIIPPDPPTNTNKMTKSEVEAFVNIMGFCSNTKNFVWTDIDRQVTHVFSGSAYKWELLRTMTCATGKNISPTKRGDFVISDKGNWFYSKRLNSGAKYWVRYSNSYLYHSVAMDKDKNITNPTLGSRQSSGCVRHSVSDAEWFYNNVDKGTSVFIY